MLGGSELVQVLLQNIICSSRIYPNDLNFITIQNPADTHVRIHFPMRSIFSSLPETFHSVFQSQTHSRSKLTGKYTQEHKKLNSFWRLVPIKLCRINSPSKHCGSGHLIPRYTEKECSSMATSINLCWKKHLGHSRCLVLEVANGRVRVVQNSHHKHNQI